MGPRGVQLMKFPAWVKTVWWLILLILLSIFIWKRYPVIISGTATASDLFIILIWVSICLFPLFQEMTFFGIKLKKEVESIRSDLKAEAQSLRSEIRNIINVRTELSQQVMLPPPVSDSQLPAIEERVKSAVEAALKSHGLGVPRELVQQFAVGEDVSFLFWSRYSIERELRRIWSQRFGEETKRRPVPIPRIIQILTETQLLDKGLDSAIREVYSVCSPAIHGEDVTQAQVSFVREVVPGLITALRAIQ
jgi:hypothetical protein